MRTALLILVTLAFCSMTEAADLTGLWLTEPGKSKILITKTATGYEGKIAWLKEPLDKKGNPKTDTNNVDKSLRSRQFFGLVTLTLTTNKNGKITGKVYSPDFGRTFDCQAYLRDDTHLVLKVCAGFISKETVWTRQK